MPGDGLNWWVGDWLIYGEGKWGEMYAQAMEITGWEYERLRNVKSVASQVQLSTRVDNLTWAHHREVAPFSSDEQRLWLQRALDAETTEGKKWSVKRLVEELRNAGLRGQPERERRASRVREWQGGQPKGLRPLA